YDELLRTKKLTMRVSIAMSVVPGDSLEKYAWRTGSWLRARAIKLIMDGVVESHTAAMLEPYADRRVSGEPVWTQDALNRIVADASKLGLQVYTHAIGDRAVRMTLDAYERVPHDRFRIEHIETISPIDLPRFAKLGVIPSMQPIHADPESAEPWED